MTSEPLDPHRVGDLIDMVLASRPGLVQAFFDQSKSTDDRRVRCASLHPIGHW